MIFKKIFKQLDARAQLTEGSHLQTRAPWHRGGAPDLATFVATKTGDGRHRTAMGSGIQKWKRTVFGGFFGPQKGLFEGFGGGCLHVVLPFVNLFYRVFLLQIGDVRSSGPTCARFKLSRSSAKSSAAVQKVAEAPLQAVAAKIWVQKASGEKARCQGSSPKWKTKLQLFCFISFTMFYFL